MKTLSCMFMLFSLLSVSAQERERKIPERLFHIPGVVFSESQTNQVAQIREKYQPQLQAHLGTRAPSMKADARRAWQQETHAIVRAMREEMMAILPPEQRAAIPNTKSDQARAKGRKPTHANVSYGPHARNLMDVWLPESDVPTPVLVSIHGGGFRAGNKSVDPAILAACLEKKIAVIALTYRFSQDAIAPACFYDCARAIQFIRHQAKTWKLDKSRISSSGGSAGAGLSLWLGFHEDLADPKNADPILRESTRLRAMAVYNGQTSYDPRVIRTLFPENDTYKHSALAQLFDVDLDQLDHLPEEKYALFNLVSATPHLTKDDPPVLLSYSIAENASIRSQSVGIHHPRFGFALKEKMDKLGVDCTVQTNTSRNSEERVTAIMKLLDTAFEQ